MHFLCISTTNFTPPARRADLHCAYARSPDAVQEEILKGAAAAAVQRREAAEASATPDERIAIQHAKAAKAKELRKREVSECHLHGLPAVLGVCLITEFTYICVETLCSGRFGSRHAGELWAEAK